MKYSILAIALLLLTGCATGSVQDDANDVNKSWRGSSKQEVVDKFGAPESISKDTLGNEVYSYSEHGPMDSMKFTFTFNSNNKVIFLKLRRYVEDEGQIYRTKANEDRMTDAINNMAPGASPPRQPILIRSR